MLIYNKFNIYTYFIHINIIKSNNIYTINIIKSNTPILTINLLRLEEFLW